MEFKICVSDLAAYNEGMLIFEWVSVDDVDEVYECIKRVLKKGTEASYNRFGGEGDLSQYEEHEEYFISDYSAPFEIDEFYSNINSMVELQERLRDVDEDLFKALYFFLDDVDEVLKVIDSGTYGIYDYGECWSLQAYMEDMDYLSRIPEKFLSYLDYEHLARDWGISWAPFGRGGTLVYEEVE